MKLFGYDFKDEALIKKALTHSSYGNEHSVECNERMEFLGDSVLSLAVSRYIFDKFPNLPEGRLSKIRASVVCEQTLALCAEKMDFGKHILLGHGEALAGGKHRPSILSDAFESVIAAIYLDGGFEKAREWILSQLEEEICRASEKDNFNDFKTVLQEKTQSMGLGIPVYTVVDSKGPDHAKTFTVSVHFGDIFLSAEGRSKKSAESAAAKSALIKLGELK